VFAEAVESIKLKIQNKKNPAYNFLIFASDINQIIGKQTQIIK